MERENDSVIRKCTFTIIALENDISDFVYGLILQLDNIDTKTGRFDTRQTAHPELKNKMVAFLSPYADGYAPLKRIIAFIKNIPDNDPFIIYPFYVPTTTELVTCFNFLNSVKTGVDFQTLEEQNHDLFGELFEKYEFHHLGTKRKNIGEPDKNKRVCRFCNNASVPLSFDNKAHAVSEALGNKTLVLYEECDQCNQRFSHDIEQDLIEYYALFRSFFAIKGKGGLKKIKGSNFTIEQSEDRNLKIAFTTDEENGNDSPPLQIPLEFNRQISRQNVYRTLVKYFLSVIASDLLPHFKNTVAWVNGKHSFERLPKIGKIPFTSVVQQPTLVYYLRKDDDTDLPFAVAELHFSLYKICYIIPGSSKDTKDFLHQDDYDHFRQFFKHYFLTDGWVFEDLSNDKKKTFQINVNIDVKKQPVDPKENNSIQTTNEND
jgi:hypothetical protein